MLSRSAGISSAGGPGAPLPVQTQAAEGGEAETATAGAGGVAAGASPIGLGERDLEDLLRKLYPKLRTQLSRELLVARERAGLLTDLH